MITEKNSENLISMSEESGKKTLSSAKKNKKKSK